MMGMSVTTNKNVGATRENWFELKGLPLINVMREKRTTISRGLITISEKILEY